MKTNIIELKESELDNVQGGSIIALATVGAVTLIGGAIVATVKKWKENHSSK